MQCFFRSSVAAVVLLHVSIASAQSSPDAGVAPPVEEAPPEILTARTSAPDHILARGHEVTLSARELAAAINVQPPMIRSQYKAAANIEAEARDLVRERLLAAEARRLKLHTHPSVRRDIDRVLGHALLSRELGRVAQLPVTADQIYLYYRQHSQEFTRPERVHISVIVLDDRDKATRMWTLARRANRNRFQSLSRRYSVDVKVKSRRGDMGWLYRETGDVVDARVVAAAFTLQREGEMVPGVVEGNDGLFYLIRLDDRVAAEPIPLEEVKGAILSRIHAERRREVIDAIVRRLSQSAGLRTTPAAPLIQMVPARPAPTTARPGM